MRTGHGVIRYRATWRWVLPTCGLAPTSATGLTVGVRGHSSDDRTKQTQLQTKTPFFLSRGIPVGARRNRCST